MKLPGGSLGPGARDMLLATFFFAGMNVGVKALARLPSAEVVLFRSLFIFAVLLLYLLRRGPSPLGVNRPWLLARGLAGCTALLLYVYTVQTMPLGSAVTLQYLAPLSTLLFGALLLGERASRRQWLFFGIAFAGIPLIKGFDPRVSGIELLAGLGAALLAGLAYTLIRKLRASDHPFVVVLWFAGVTIPIAGLISVFSWVRPTSHEWLALLWVGGCTTAFQMLITRAYQADTAARVSVYNYLGVVWAVILGYVIFDERLSILAYLGCALIIAGAGLATREGSNRSDNAPQSADPA